MADPENWVEPNNSPSHVRGKKLLRIIVESVVRAGVKMLPFVGSGLDQATFGTKDAIAGAEIKLIVEEILNIVRKLHPSSVEPNTIPADPIIQELLKRPVVRKLVEKLEDGDVATRRSLAQFLSEIESDAPLVDGRETDLRRLQESIDTIEDTLVERLEISQRSREREFERVRENLNHIIRHCPDDIQLGNL